MTFQTIQELNKYYAENCAKLEIYEYIQKLHDTFYQNVDLSFMEYFLSYIEQDGQFVIDAQESLYKFGAINAKKKDSSAIIKTLQRSGLKENEDYQLRQLSEPVPQGGFTKINKYMLTPDAFKKVLLDVHNHTLRKKHIDYYLFLEKTIKYFQDYSIIYKDYILSGKDEKIDEQSKKIDSLFDDNKELKNKIDKQSKKMDEQSKQIDEILGYARDTKTKLEETNEKVEELHETVDELHDQNEDLHEKVDELRDTVRDRNAKVNIDPEDTTKIDSYALFRVKEDKYRILCGQIKYVQRHLRNVNENDILIQSSYNPNPKTMFIRVKEKINEHIQNGEKWIKTRYKTIIIQEMKYENQLIELVKQCDNERSNLDIP